MVRIIKDTVTKTHVYDGNGNETIFTDTIEQYHYGSEEEKNEHRKLMEAKGFSVSGQAIENIADMTNPIYAWFGSYCNRSERKVVVNMLVQAANAADI